MIYSLLLSIALMVAVHGVLAAQPPAPVDRIDTIPKASKGETRWFVPYVGGYVRSPFGFALEVGARGGIEIVHNIVGVTAEVGFIAFTPSDNPGMSPTFGAHAVRLEVTPLPFGFMKPFIFHVAQRFFGGPMGETTGRLGYGFSYRSETPGQKLTPYFDCTFVTARDSGVPFPFFGGGLIVTF